MKQLFYNAAGGIVHKIRREKRTTISEMIVRGKREILSKINKIGIGFISIFLLKAHVSYALTRAAHVKKFWRSHLLTPSARTIGILSTLTCTEFDCPALRAM